MRCSWPDGTPATGLPNPEEGREVALILVVSPTCPASRAPELRELWAELKSSAVRDLTSARPNVSFIGIALSHNSDLGVEFLRRFGDFHEISAGRGSVNIGALRYMVDNFRGVVAVPQVIIVHRDFANRDGIGHLESETVVQRLSAWTT